MTDREMLEFAAKAAGVPGKYNSEETCTTIGWQTVTGIYFDGLHSPLVDAGGVWNPLDDDGDGARMEAALGIHVTWHSDGVVCGKRIWQETEMFEDHNGDKQAARRIASLRIAAEIGKAMP